MSVSGPVKGGKRPDAPGLTVRGKVGHDAFRGRRVGIVNDPAVDHD
jgi:hypothetical protein